MLYIVVRRSEFIWVPGMPQVRRILSPYSTSANHVGNPLTASKVLYKLDPLLLLITTRHKVRGVKHFVEREELARQMFYLSLRVSNCVLVCHSVDYSTPVERIY